MSKENDKICFYLKHDDRASKEHINEFSQKKLLTVCIICTCFMLIEFIGGFWSKSLAIMTDAAHLLSDLVGFLISILALRISKNPPNLKYTFGYYRAEIVGALSSVTLIWILTILLLSESIKRIFDNHHKIDSEVMVYSASFGLMFNIVMAYILHSEVDCTLFRKEDVVIILIIRIFLHYLLTMIL